MNSSERYFYGKLVGINYSIAIHEGDANRRLASEADRILILFISEAPEKYRKEFGELYKILEKAMMNIPQPGMKLYRIYGIRNKTAAKYIKMLIDMEYYMREALSINNLI